MLKRGASLAFLLAFCVQGGVWAQQDPQYTQNMFDRLSVNPASAGTGDFICATGFFREQWSGFANDVNSPTESMLNVEAPLTPLGVPNSGAGLTVYYDYLGQEESTVARFSYSYQKPVGIGKVSGGIAIGAINKTLGSTWKPPQTNPAADETIPNDNASSTTYDISLGAYYKTNKMYMGISSTHLTKSSASFDASDYALDMEMQRHFYVMAGYDYNINGNPMYVLKPSIFAKTDGASAQFDVNVNFMYNDQLWAGVSYRPADAVAPLVGYKHRLSSDSQLKVGYSYDVTTSELNDHSNGSHELMVKYCFKLIKPPKRQKVKDVRFM